MTKDEIRAEIERLQAEYERLESEDRAKYKAADDAFTKAGSTAPIGQRLTAGLIAAWPFMPETRQLKDELAALKGAMAMKGFTYDVEHSTLELRKEYEPGVWYDWHGGECPIKNPSTDIKVRFRDGEEEICKANYYKSIWFHAGSPCDITAFRILPN